MLGLAVLSKVSALFPAIGIVLPVIIKKDKRYCLKNIHYYFFAGLDILYSICSMEFSK